MKTFKLHHSNYFILLFVLAATLVSGSAFANNFFGFWPGNIVLTRSVYSGYASLITPDVTVLPTGVTAVTDGSYPYVFNNATNNGTTVDGSFGITSPIYLDQLTPGGALVNSLDVTGIVWAHSGTHFATSFSSKSELAVNLSQDGGSLTLMGYVAPVNTLDVSNSNTPNHVDPTNPVTYQTTPTPTFQRAVARIDFFGKIQVTPVDAYSGNNGRAAILACNGYYYMVGNAGNGSGAPPTDIVDNTGVQITTPGGPAETTVVGMQQGTPGQKNGFQYGYSVTQYGYPADKSGKDNNFRGERIFDNTLYVTKGSGGNGINTVFQVGEQGSLPTATDASSTTITILPGFPTTLASSSSVGHPFGIWFANPTTLYVADEGDGTTADAATDPNSGLQKWSLLNGQWTLDYVLKNGLNLGRQYSVANGPNGEVYPTNLNPATDGLRNITGIVHKDGTVTIYAITSTVSASGDQGADPNKLVAITDTLSTTTLSGNEAFLTLKTAGYGEVYRGVSKTPSFDLFDLEDLYDLIK